MKQRLPICWVWDGGNYPDFSRWAQSNHANVINVKSRIFLSTGGRHGMWMTSRSWERSGNRFSPAASKRNALLLTSSVVRPVLEFWSPKLYDNKFVFFEAIKAVVICYNSSRKLIEFHTNVWHGQMFSTSKNISSLGWATLYLSFYTLSMEGVIHVTDFKYNLYTGDSKRFILSWEVICIFIELCIHLLNW